MYCIPMIPTGYNFQFFIFYASHQTRRNSCGKFIFHIDLQRKKLIKCSATLVVQVLDSPPFYNSLTGNIEPIPFFCDNMTVFAADSTQPEYFLIVSNFVTTAGLIGIICKQSLAYTTTMQ